jgi:hypothetical protein
MFLMMLTLQGSYNIMFLGIGKEHLNTIGLFFITAVCLFALSL